MKILFLVTSLNAGGKERQTVELIKSLITKGVDCQLILLKDEIEYDDIYATNIKLHIIDKSTNKPLAVINSIRKICKSFDPDIIQAWDVITAMYAGPIAKSLRIPFINYSIQYAVKIKPLSRHGLFSSFSFLFSYRVVSNSKAGLRAHGKKPSKKYRYVHNGYDFKRVSLDKTKKELKNSFGFDKKYVVGMIGNFVNAKDYNTYVVAALKILANRDDVIFVGIGDGYDIDKIRALVPAEKKGNFFFPGRINGVETYIQTFDIGCLICNTNGHAEGISNSIMEIMALGIPVIATDSGGTKEIILDEETGFVIPAFDTDVLVEKINYLLDHEDERLEMGKKSHDRIEKEFSINHLGNSFLDIYKEVL